MALRINQKRSGVSTLKLKQTFMTGPPVWEPTVDAKVQTFLPAPPLVAKAEPSGLLGCQRYVRLFPCSNEAMYMNIPIPAETPDPNIDDPTLPPPDPAPIPEQEPPGAEPTPIGDPPSEHPPIKVRGKRA